MAIQWPLVLFTLIAGAGAGLMAFVGLGEFIGSGKKTRLISLVISLVLLVVGGVFSIFHLGHPANVMNAATNIGSLSPISLELLFIGICVVVNIIYLIIVNRAGAAAKVFGILGIVFGVVFMYITGHGYSVILTRPAWANPVLALAYLFTSLTLGGFIWLIMQSALKDEAASVKKSALVVFIVAIVETIVLLVYGALAPLGSSTVLFWICAFVIGGVIAAAAGMVVYLKKNVGLIWVGAACALVGGVVFRAVMWAAGTGYIPNLLDVSINNRGLYPF
ncbi:MAG: dimethyl sulfoxide reductase anchor subunit [Coriobacteriia bacterium]|nr:dimethyl sulfoxide reductase anchor subunit [Coriobacteriia bacterium]